MKTKFYTDVEDFCLSIIENHFEFLKNEFNEVAIVVLYKEAKEIIREFIFNDFELKHIELENDCEGEFVITIKSNGEIWCEKAKQGTDYFNIFSSTIYINSDVNSKIIKYLFAKKELIEFDLIDVTDELEDGDCSEICECCDYMEDDEMKDIETFSYTITNRKGYHCYSITSSDEDELKKFKQLILEL